MSSTEYFAEFQPDPRLRRLVAWSGVLLALAGIVVLLQLPLDLWIRLVACTVWAATSAREHRQLHLGWKACLGIRFVASGEILVLGTNGSWYPARRETGSVLLRKIGWIRLRNHRGVVFGELLSGDDRTSPDWRRLQVLWRHVGA